VKMEIKEDFEIAAHDVTQGQWEAVMGTNPSWFKRDGGGSGYIRNVSDEELKLFPVEQVSWDDAQAFIQKLNERERGRGYVYRLPTEAEWEYACRGGATSKEECLYNYYFDTPTKENYPSSEKANFDGTRSRQADGLKGKYLARPTRVGAYPPNRLGLCDMHGNVWQWCADQFEGRVERGAFRVFRGGSWFENSWSCRAAGRNSVAAGNGSYDRGFRLVRVPVRTK
jgi:formylglycine-generating enzyme required for sulfatase activity